MHALAQHRRREHAAVEEDRVAGADRRRRDARGTRRGGAGSPTRSRTASPTRGARCRRSLRGRASDGDERKEAVAARAPRPRRVSTSAASVPAMTPRAAARHLHRGRLGLAGRSRRSLASAALHHQRLPAHAVELPAVRRRGAPPRARASAMSMLSPPSSRWSPTATRSSASVAVGCRRRDQREVGRAAADVDDQDQRRRRRAPPSPVALVRGEPRVERGLRLLEQRDVAAARLRARAATRELARDLVERRRHGEHDVLRRRAARRDAPRPTRRGGARGSAPTPSTGESCGTSSAGAPRQDRGACGRRRRGRATTSPTRRAGPARARLASRASSPTTSRRSSAHGRASAPGGTSWAPAR